MLHRHSPPPTAPHHPARRAALFGAALLLAGCGAGLTGGAEAPNTQPPTAQPASAATPQAALAQRLATLLAAHEVTRLAASGLPGSGARADRAARRAEALNTAPAPVTTPPGPQRFEALWRHAEAALVLGDRPPRGPPRFAFPGVGALETTLRLRSVAPGALTVQGRCDGPVRLWQGATSRPTAAAGARFTLTVAPGLADGTRLVLGPDTDRCDLDITPAGGRPGWRLELLRDALATPALAALETRFDVCATPPGMDRLERAVLGEGWLSRSCLMPPGPMRLLPGAVEAFDAKAMALTGRPLPAAAIAAGDPEYPLDFTQAPALELIVVSYLQLRADFSGRMLVRMLEHHAARGVPVRILVSANLQTGKDRRMLDRLAAAYPSVQLQAYRWRPPPGLALSGLPDRLQRGHHAKLFATLAKTAGESRFITGGRNLHDGFLVTEPFDLAAHPALHDYASRLRNPLAYFAAYDDLEVELAGDAAVRAMVAQFLTLWNHDENSFVIRPFALRSEAPGAPRRGALQFLSVPHADGRALERWLAGLFDAAEDRIDLVSPYLNLTPPLVEALESALNRGVSVSLLLPELVGSDPLSGFKSAVEAGMLRRFAGRVEVWRHAKPGRLLHVKAVVVDRRLSVVTSANLNARSMLHDTENGVAVLDEGFAAELLALRDGWLERSEPLRRVPAAGPLGRLLKASERMLGWF